MTKYDTIIEKLATLTEQNKTQTRDIAELKTLFSKHNESSDIFRRKCSNNGVKIHILFGVVTVILTTIGYLVFGV